MARSVIDEIMIPDSAELAERVQAVKYGIEAKRVVQLADRLGWHRQRLLDALGLKRATVNSKLRTGKALAPSQGSRVIGVERLICYVHRIVEESGDLEGFDAALWLGQWLNSTVPALGDRRPAEYLDTVDGQQLVARTIAQIQSCAY